MEEYEKWLENKIEACLEDDNLQKEHWAFCVAFEKFKSIKDKKLKVETYVVETTLGMVNIRESLQFVSILTLEELQQFNYIGYSGKNLKEEKTTRQEFLNSIGKGHFSVQQIKFDWGDFTERFLITKIIL